MSLPKLDQLKTLFLKARVDFKQSVLAVINAVSEELENFVEKVEVKVTLSKDGWKDDDYTVDLSSYPLTGDETYLVGVDFSASETAKEEFVYTGIEGKSQSKSGIVLHCLTAPIEDIPVIITILGKVKE